MVLETLFRTAAGASVLTVVIMLIRRLFGEKLDLNIRYFLWLFVALRILIPVSIDYDLPEIGWFKGVQEPNPILESDGVMNGRKQQDIPEYNNIESYTEPFYEKPLKIPAQPTKREKILSMDKIFTLIWLIGAAGLGSYILMNNFRFYTMVKRQRKVAGMTHNKIPVYELKGYNCLLGIFNPGIYMDPQAYGNPKLSQHVILHELQHYRIKDNLWILIRTICLSLQWFNPFVWLAYVESGRDCELACDYRVIKNMENEERFLYGESLLSVAGFHVNASRKPFLATSMGREKRIMKKRIENIMKYSRTHKKIWILPCILLLLVAIAVSINITKNTDDANAKSIGNDKTAESGTNLTKEAENKVGESNIQKLQIEMSDYYITNTGNPGNLYYIDEQKTLWGSGENQYGQLGQGNQDTEFHEELVKIAENVIHVDFSQTGFMIFLTEDQKLYGCGNGGVGALQQLELFSGEQHDNGGFYAVTKPVLLMENVLYARCGRYDIAAVDIDHNVWNWGVIWYENRDNYDYQKEPQKILDNTILVTGGMYNHAALKEDGSVWTWGYNYTGNCGVPNEPVISKPQKVAEDVRMVWTGSLDYNIDCQNIKEFGDFYERGLENTIIQKNDGSFWICGVNVGTEEKLLPIYYEAVDYRIVCTYEFLPYEMNDENVLGTLQ